MFNTNIFPLVFQECGPLFEEKWDFLNNSRQFLKYYSNYDVIQQEIRIWIHFIYNYCMRFFEEFLFHKYVHIAEIDPLCQPHSFVPGTVWLRLELVISSICQLIQSTVFPPGV